MQGLESPDIPVWCVCVRVCVHACTYVCARTRAHVLMYIHNTHTTELQSGLLHKSQSVCTSLQCSMSPAAAVCSNHIQVVTLLLQAGWWVYHCVCSLANRMCLQLPVLPCPSHLTLQYWDNIEWPHVWAYCAFIRGMTLVIYRARGITLSSLLDPLCQDMYVCALTKHSGWKPAESVAC